MIRDTTAQRIASDWHGGGGTALYQFASSGAITQRIEGELNHLIYQSPEIIGPEKRKLKALRLYVNTNGPRDAQPNWYQHVICQQ